MSYLVYLTSNIQVKSNLGNRPRRCLPATNESTSNYSYLKEELGTNNSNDLLPVMHSETNPDRTKLLEKEVDNLRKN